MISSGKDQTKPNIFEMQVLAGKLKPPRLRYVLDRPRLLRMATPVDSQKLVLICAGPGYGKTTLMAQIARYYPGRYVWYQVDTLDSDPAVFLRHLITGISQACDGIGGRAMVRLEEATDAGREGESILAVLTNELNERLQTPLAICFDDFHLFDGVDFAGEFVNHLVEGLPDGAAVFITSRTEPRMSLARMRTRGTLLQLKPDDLQFSMEELKELLSETWSMNVDESIYPQLLRNTEGWPAGLVLMEDHLRSGNSVPEIFTRRKMRRHVYEFLAEEVLSRQSKSLQDLLKKSSLIDPIDSDICKAALGIKDAAALLSAAEKMNLFTTRVGDTDLFRFHPLFRDFLQMRVKEDAGTEGLQKLYLKFGKAFEAAGDQKRAIEQYLKADEKELARTLVEKIGEEMLINNEHTTLHRWLQFFTEGSSLLLDMYQGQILILSGSPLDALHLLRAVKSRVDDTSNEIAYSISISIAECLIFLGRPLDGVQELEPLLNKTCSSEMKLKLLDTIIDCYIHDYNGEKVLQWICVAKKIAEDNLFPSQKLEKIEAMRNSFLLWTGEFSEAHKLLESIMNNKEISACNKNRYTNNLASCLMLLGDYDAAKIYSENCVATALGQKENRRLHCFYDTHGCILSAQGDSAEGEVYLKEAIKIVTNACFAEVETCPMLCHLGTFSRRNGDYEAATRYHSSSYEIAALNNYHYDSVMGLVNLGADMVRREKFDTADEYLIRAKTISERYNFNYALTQIDYQYAWFSHLVGNQKKVVKHLSKALKRASGLQHNHFIIQESKIALPLLTVALSHGIETNYVLWIMEKIGPDSLKAIAPILEHEKREIREQCARLLSRVPDPSAIALARKLRRDKDPEIKKLALKALTFIRKDIYEPNELLTVRENQILAAVSEGLSNGQIAQKYFISERTVKTHITNIFRKLGLTNRLEAALLYQENERKNTT